MGCYASGTVREFLKKALPRPLVDWIRRRLAVRRYLRAISYELLARDTRLDDLEAQIAARRDGFYDRLVLDVLDRTDLVMQQLDRKIEGVNARHGERIADLEAASAELTEAIGAAANRHGGAGPAGLSGVRLAWLSPLPPIPSGISDYSAEILPFLAERADVTAISPKPKGLFTRLHPPEGIAVRRPGDVPARGLRRVATSTWGTTPGTSSCTRRSCARPASRSSTTSSPTTWSRT